jgi:hypothetical protein
MQGIEEFQISAQELGLDLHSLSRRKSETVEERIVDFYSTKGWRGVAVEGSFISLALKCIAHPKVKPRHASFHATAASVFLQPKGSPNSASLFSLSDLHANTSTTSIDDALATYDALSPASGFKSVSFDGRINRSSISDFLSSHRNFLIELSSVMFVQYRLPTFAGFPDVTLWDNDHVWLIEVKTPNDRLQSSQKQFFSKLAPYLPCRTSILHVEQ